MVREPDINSIQEAHPVDAIMTPIINGIRVSGRSYPPIAARNPANGISRNSRPRCRRYLAEDLDENRN